MEQKISFSQEPGENALTRINIINFIDVALVLVITLLMVSPMIEQGLDVRLPVSGPAKMEVEKNIILTVARDGTIYWGNREITLTQLEKVASDTISRNPSTGIIIKADRNISYQEIINVLDILKKADIKRIGLATQAK